MEGMETGEWENKKNTIAYDAAFHADPEKQHDEVEALLERLGPDGAVDELNERLANNPEDAEARRMANLLANKLEELLSQLREKTQH